MRFSGLSGAGHADDIASVLADPGGQKGNLRFFVPAIGTDSGVQRGGGGGAGGIRIPDCNLFWDFAFPVIGTQSICPDTAPLSDVIEWSLGW